MTKISFAYAISPDQKPKGFHFSHCVRRVSKLWMLVLIITLSVCVQQAQAAQSTSVDPATQLLALLNDWRIQQGLWPLKVNPTLQMMAQTQAEYVLTNINNVNSEADYHLDALKQMPQQRAQRGPYLWPTYGLPSQIEIGENAAVGSPKFAISFWQNSDIHRKAALNSDYREVGIGVVPYQGFYIFIADFGARPGILTTEINPAGNTLYFSDETSSYADLDPNTMQIRLFDSTGKPLTDSLSWTPTYTLPTGTSGTLYVLYTDGSFQTLDQVRIPDDVAVLPVTQVAIAATLTIETPTALPTTETNSTSTDTLAPNVDQFAAGLTPTPTVAPTVTPTLAVSNPDLILVYDDQSLTVYNNAGKTVDLTGFSVGSSSSRVSIDSWAAVASFNRTAFPTANCLEVRLINSEAPAYSNCRFVRSVIELSAIKLFWTQSVFTVTRGFKGGATLATCNPTAKRCDVKLS